MSALPHCKAAKPWESSSKRPRAGRGGAPGPCSLGVEAADCGRESDAARKLLLASAMMRQCDILLLDEPTNHLDKESVAWLSKYLVSLTQSTLMVISHDPYFLNEVCTDIIQYSGQKTLEYYPGNFADFREAKKLSDQDSEALLLGNEVDLGESPDIPAEEVDSGLALTAAALDKQAKITFPIPGKLSGHSAGASEGAEAIPMDPRPPRKVAERGANVPPQF
ncbi:unnamed protein product [Prorocentrum cordatum]|uniref:ABC transporter domain-containing protein n=1 Tax=Prorocentrum cordatum TaxID=2364126 RepID=A0ABN9VEK8_9DINO|nr:unnamed protein product [Polarella glacialis]